MTKFIVLIYFLAVSGCVSALKSKDESEKFRCPSSSLSCLSLFKSEKGLDLSFSNEILLEQQRAVARNLGVNQEVFGTKIYHHPIRPEDAKPGFPGIRNDSKAIVLAFGGAGTTASTGKTWAREAKTYTEFGVDVVSLDYPFHGDGPKSAEFMNAEVFIAQMIKIIKFYRSSGKPIYLLGHSFGSTVIKEILFRSPEIAHGAILSSPGGGITPKLFRFYWDNEKHIVANAYSDDYINQQGGKWIDSMEAQFLSNKNVKTQNRIPVKIVSGDNDLLNTPELLADLKNSFTDADLQIYPGVTHLIFKYKGAEHNLLVEEMIAFIEGNQKIKLQYVKQVFDPIQEIRTYSANSELFRQWLQIAKKNVSAITRDERAARGALKEWSLWYSQNLRETTEKLLATSSLQQFPAKSVDAIRALLLKKNSDFNEQDQQLLIQFVIAARQSQRP